MPNSFITPYIFNYLAQENTHSRVLIQVKVNIYDEFMNKISSYR
ncbi:hypothetical protein A6A12_1129 [Vibrio anguillarum]|nr:hypothetical protein A6A12_1129 [Vibrio anguillarum]